MRSYLVIFLLAAAFGAGHGQTGRPGGKPVLIRDDEPKEEEKVIIHNPAMARESAEIGDFYFKRHNYRAAEQRYREAIEYDTKWHEPYEKLIRALEESGDYSAALEACALYEANNPGSPMIREFQEKARKIEKKSLQ